MHLAAIWRYPVKSFQGEQLTEAVLGSTGVHADRSWGIRDEATGRILTGRREPELLLASASLDADGEPEIALPSGERCHGVGPGTDAALTEWLGRTVTLVAAADTPGARAEYFADATDDASPPIEWTMPDARFVDNMPLLVLTTASIRAGAHLHPAGDWNVRRFRPNLLVDVDDAEGWVEDAWCGRTVQVGPTALAPRQPCIRCTMVTRPQPGITRDLDVYRCLARHHGGTLGVWSDVGTPGTVRTGAPVVLGP